MKEAIRRDHASEGIVVAGQYHPINLFQTGILTVPDGLFWPSLLAFSCADDIPVCMLTLFLSESIVY